MPFPRSGPTIVLVCGDPRVLQRVAAGLRDSDAAVRSVLDPLDALAILHESVADAVWVIDTEEVPCGEWLSAAMAVDQTIFPVSTKLFWVSDRGLVGSPSRNLPLAGTFDSVPSTPEILRLTRCAASRGLQVGEG